MVPDSLNIEFPVELLSHENRAGREEPERGILPTPSLMLGLGSTGISVLTHLKLKCAHYFGSSAEAAEVVQFLMLDIGEPEKQVMDHMDRNDFQALPVENIRLMANHLKHQKESFSRWWEPNFDPIKKDLSDCTGGMRQLPSLQITRPLHSGFLWSHQPAVAPGAVWSLIFFS